MMENIIAVYNKNFQLKDMIKLLEDNGWECTTPQSSTPKFRRDGKEKGHSAQIINNNECLLFHNFSTNANLPQKSNGKDTYNPYELVYYYYFNGSHKEATEYCRRYLAGLQEVKSCSPVEQVNKKFVDQFTHNTKKILNEVGDELFTIAVNEHVIDKNISKLTFKEHNDYTVLTKNFKNHYLTQIEIALAVGKGYAISPSCFKEQSDGSVYKSGDNWVNSNLIILDVDKGSLESILQYKNKYFNMIYTTVNHTEEENRFRLLCPVDFTFLDSTVYERTLKLLSIKYKADVKATSKSNCFYGNRNANFYFTETQVSFNFENGELKKFSDPEGHLNFYILYNTEKSAVKNFSSEEELQQYIVEVGVNILSIQLVGYNKTNGQVVPYLNGEIWKAQK